jgi:hypothetical protein
MLLDVLTPFEEAFCGGSEATKQGCGREKPKKKPFE